MTRTDLQDALAAVAEAAPVPPVDRLDFERRVRRERRQRTARLAASAVAGAAAVAACLAVVTDLAPAGDPSGTEPAASAPADASAVGTIALAVDDRLQVLNADGDRHESDVAVEDVLALTDRGIVVVGRESELLLVPLSESGATGPATPLVDDAVQGAVVSPDGTELAYVDLTDRAHVLELGRDVESAPPVRLNASEMLLSVDDGRLLTWQDNGLLLRDGATTTEITGPEEPASGQLAGSTVAYQAHHSAWMFDPEGTERVGELGAGVGGLSPDGAWYASAPSGAQLDQQRSNVLQLIDTATGEVHPVGGYDDHGPALQIRWTSADRFLVVQERAGDRVLLDCSQAAGSCEERLTDRTGTLEIARP